MTVKGELTSKESLAIDLLLEALGEERREGLSVKARSTAWTDVLLISLYRIPIVAFFVPIALWLAWYSVAFLRKRRRTLRDASHGPRDTRVPIPWARDEHVR
jgi:hypothetical protein